MTILVHSFDNAQIYRGRLFTLPVKADSNYQRIYASNEMLQFLNNIQGKNLVGAFCKIVRMRYSVERIKVIFFLRSNVAVNSYLHNYFTQ